MSNTLQDYMVNYIKVALDSRYSNYDKLYRELSSKIEKIVKLAVSEAKHCNPDLEGIYQQISSSKKLLHTFSKQELLNFLDTHLVKKEIIDEFNKHSPNKTDLEVQDLINKINAIVLVQKTEKGEEINIAKILAHTIHPPKRKSKAFQKELLSVGEA